MYTPTVRATRIDRPARRHTVRTVIISVLSTIAVIFIGLAVIGTVVPGPASPAVKSVTVKTATH
jgi:hypothetical protein